MSKTHVPLCFLSLLILLFDVSLSSSFVINDPVVGLVACRPHHIQAFTQFKSEFDTRGCNHSDNYNGVWCDNSTGEITQLKLRSCLSGSLKPNSSLFKLHHLRHLSLRENNFTSSSFPSSFNNLSRLFHLNLWGNGLSGNFPHIWNLTKLSFLDLGENHFSGTLNTNSGLFELHHLRYLNLENNNFISSIPSEFGNLNRLEVLSLSNNGFFGQVPPAVSNLTRLTYLSLSNNKLTGRSPLVQNLTELSVLDLSANNFSGTIQSSLLTMPFLSILDMSDNHLTGSFEVPTFSSLKALDLGNNNFGAQILEPISKLINLTNLGLSFLNTTYPIDLGLFSSFKYLSYLDLSYNNIYPARLSLHSYLPSTIQYLYLVRCGISEFPNIRTLHNLDSLDISENLIKGKIPEWLWSLPRLGIIYIKGNSFNGFEGPAEVLVNSSVQMLFMSSNNFQGALPDLPLSIKIIMADNNKFTGEIPLSICNRSSLRILNLPNNSFIGPIPQCMSNFRHISLRMNNLEGSIPDLFYAGASLQTLDVSFNQITGKLPRSLANCSALTFLNVENNNIEDTFPFFLKALPNLRVLDLSSNKFYGPISPSHHGPLGFPTLGILEIADNKFTGSLSQSYFEDWKAPSEKEDGGLYMEYELPLLDKIWLYRNGMALRYKGLNMEHVWVIDSYNAIDFSGNLLEGNIPESIGFLKALIALNLSNNAFTGHIPLSLANLTELQSLDMSENQLSGTIPNGLGSLSFLGFINVSHNQLRGEIPQGPQITGQPESSFEGNAGLCGLPLKENCFETSAPPTHQQEDDKEDDEEEEVLNWKGVVTGYGVGVLFGFVIARVIASYKLQ